MNDALQTWTRGRTRVVVAGWAWLAAATYFASDALMGGVFGFCALLVVGFVIGVAWAWCSLFWLGNLWTRRGLLLWLTVPAAPVVAVVFGNTAWPLTARVWLCESALRTHVAAIVADGPHGPGRVGLFAVEGTATSDNGAVVFTTRYAWFDSGGLLYVPGDMPQWWARDRVDRKHLYGPWYRWQIID